MAGVSLINARKVYPNGFEAIKDASFDVVDGEFLVFVGPSGCGKSTLLRMIAGLEDISSGEIRIGDRVVNDVLPKDRDIAMVFQNYALYPHMSVSENMAFGLKVRKYPKAEIKKRVQEAAEILGLEAVLNRKPGEMSGGQRQRVAVGRAIVRKPAVFLFDEPLSNLDAKLRVQMRTEISKLHKKLGTTMIYVTHDQVEAMTMGDRIVVLDAGDVQQIDTPLNLYNHPVNQFVAGFIGSPAMNFLPGTRTNDTFSVIGDICRVTLPSQYSGVEGATIGIRPEDVYVYGETGGDLGHWTINVLEPMGHEIVLYGSNESGGVQHNVVARLKPQELPEVGQTIHLGCDLEKLHLFDIEGGAI